MDKPITLLHQEFVENLAKLINESRLPAFVVRSALNEAIVQLDSIAEQQYLSDKAKYNNQTSNG